MSRNAIARITIRSGDRILATGTGFLAAHDTVLTALHVVAHAEGNRIVIEFPGHATTATVDRSDGPMDWASLRCDGPPGVAPLPLRELRATQVSWSAYGWPQTQSVDGMTVHGTVTNPDARIKGHPALQLFCNEAAAGAGMKISGLSGAPILHDGAVVGIARFALMTDGRTEAGTFYATPVKAAGDALGLDTPPFAAKNADPNLQLLLGRVKQFWIDGVLERSIRGAGMELSKEERPDAIDHPWEAVVEVPNESSKVVPPGTTALELFDDLQGSVLVLGQPGSGKTTTLLQLARDLIARAEHEPERPAPVVFHLSTWTDGPLTKWIEREFSSKYQIPQRISRRWIEGNRLVLMLDGLDEVAVERRDGCVAAINEFVAECGLAGIAVTSRTAEYEALSNRLRVNGAICLQPLSDEQIEVYVEQGGEHLAGLKTMIGADPTLQDLARSPLMLSVMSLAYRGVAPTELPQFDSPDERRKHLFETYIDRMFKHRAKSDGGYPREQTMAWLTRVARDLKQRGRSVFLVENMQPSGGLYLSLFALGFGLVLGAIVAAMWLAPNVVGELEPYWIHPAEVAAWLVACPIWVLLVGLTERRWPVLRPAWRCALNIALWIPVAAGMTLILHHSFGWNKPAHLLFACPVTALLVAMRGQPRNLTWHIAPVESLRFSARSALRSLRWGLPLGLVLGAMAAYWLGDDWPAAFGVVGAMTSAVAIFDGFAPRVVKGKTTPNQGMRLSVRNGLRLGLAGLVPAAFVPLSSPWFSGGDNHILRFTLASFTVAFATLALWFGLLDALKHYVLRTVIWLTGQGPWRLPRFLNHACRLAFMQRVGSGYLFMHRLMLEHFANAAPDRESPARRDTP